MSYREEKSNRTIGQKKKDNALLETFCTLLWCSSTPKSFSRKCDQITFPLVYTLVNKWRDLIRMKKIWHGDTTFHLISSLFLLSDGSHFLVLLLVPSHRNVWWLYTTKKEEWWKILFPMAFLNFIRLTLSSYVEE